MEMNEWREKQKKKKIQDHVSAPLNISISENISFTYPQPKHTTARKHCYNKENGENWEGQGGQAFKTLH